MGIFNYVEWEGPCPSCGEILDDWQTKDGDCYMTTVHPHDVRHFYTNCDSCGAWVDARVRPPKGEFYIDLTSKPENSGHGDEQVTARKTITYRIPRRRKGDR